MTPIRSINYATWAIWASVTLVAVLNAGWVRVISIEGGGAFPLTLDFFVISNTHCIFSDMTGSLVRHTAEFSMVPANLIVIGVAMAFPRSRFGTAAAAYTLITVALTLMFVGEPRLVCSTPVVANHNIHGYSGSYLSSLEGITLFDVISLVPRFLYLALFLVTPVQWAPVGAWMRDGSNRRVNATLTS